MPALPRHKDQTRPRDAFRLILIEGLERMTTALRRGDPLDARSVEEIEQVCRRADALQEALHGRLHLVESDDND